MCNIAFGHDSWEICDNTVLNWQFGIHCKGTRIEHGPSIFINSRTGLNPS